MAAADCMTRAWALAIATAACVGLPAALVYAVVRVAAAHRLATTIALSAFLAVWVAVSAAYYPRAFADIVRWFALSRYLRGHRARARARHTATRTRRRALLPRFVVVAQRSRQEEAEDHGDGGGMGVLPREPPAAARGGAARVVGAGEALVAYCDGRRRRDGGEACEMSCVVCLCDVEKVETAAWLPGCLHVFHRQCIERWLHDHSTCPICRCDA